MNIKFLHAQEDIPQFVEYIYNQGYSLIKQAGEKPNVPLSQSEACCSLTADLNFSETGMNYSIVHEDVEVLVLSSCGRQSHPRHTYTRYREPGYLIYRKEEKSSDSEVHFVFFRKYFKKNYIFQNYIPNVRASCFWGKGYLQLNCDYNLAPDADNIRNGYIRMVAKKEFRGEVWELLEQQIPSLPGLIRQELSCHMFWADNACVEFFVEIWCDSESINYELFKSFMNRLAETNARVIFKDDARFYAASSAGGWMKTPKRKWDFFGKIDKLFVLSSSGGKL